MIRPEQVDALVLGWAGDLDPDTYRALIESSTAEEITAVAVVLGRAARWRPTVSAPSLLAFDYRAAVALGMQGLAMLWLADRLLPMWTPHPDMKLSDVGPVGVGDGLGDGDELLTLVLALDVDAAVSCEPPPGASSDERGPRRAATARHGARGRSVALCGCSQPTSRAISWLG
jgi:hypothetical protein